MPHDVLSLDPVPTLRKRVAGELAASFAADRPTRFARAPGRLDVMGGIADYTGSLVLEMPLGVAAAVALQPRDDDQFEAFSFNLLDDHKPFQFRMPTAALARPYDELRADLGTPGRDWAGYVAGPLAVLHHEGLVDATKVGGLTVAIYSTVPSGGGVSSSAAVEVAVMNALVDHLGLDTLRTDPVRLAALCQKAENLVVGAPCGVMDQVASHLGEEGRLLKMLCQPHDVQGSVALPAGVRVIGINTNVKHSVGGGAYGRTRAAAFMGHRILLDLLADAAKDAGKSLRGDPTGGYLANLDPADYKALFRPKLPEVLTGGQFVQQYGDHGDAVTTLEDDVAYRVQAACDHHVLEAQRVRRFADFLESVDTHGRDKALRSCGHLMYASHKSYTDNAGLGAAECDAVVQLVKQHESAGLYGAKITGGGSGGTVAVLLEDTSHATTALDEILRSYRDRTGLTPNLLDGSSPGAQHVATVVT
jgi:L-arabinokinase